MDIHSVRQQLKTKSIYDIPLRVTYYARVSSESDEQLNSLGNQITYYEDLIKRNQNWTFVPGYIDEGLSGRDETLVEQLGIVDDFSHFAVNDTGNDLKADCTVVPVNSVADMTVSGTEQNGIGGQSVAFFFFKNDINIAEQTAGKFDVAGNFDFDLESTADRINGRSLVRNNSTTQILAVQQDVDRRLTLLDEGIIHRADVGDDFKTGQIFDLDQVAAGGNIFAFFKVGFGDGTVIRRGGGGVRQILFGDDQIIPKTCRKT